MALLARHPGADLIRYIDNALDAPDRTEVEQHLVTCEPCRKELSFVRAFNIGLAELTPDERVLVEPCPDSWTLSSYEAGEVDDGTARRIRAHLLFCGDCRDDYCALRRARPKRLEILLRVARGIIDALRIREAEPELVPAGAITRGALRKALAAPFRVSQSLTDSEGRTSTVTLRVENAIHSPEDHVRIVVECDPVQRTWRSHLSDREGTDLVDLSINRRQAELSAELDHGFYVLKIADADDTLGEFSFTVESFSVPEASETVLAYLRICDYDRALAIAEDAVTRYPEDQDLWDLRSLALTMAAKDAEKMEEQATQVRGVRDFVRDAWQAVGEVKARFGETIASIVGVGTLAPMPARAVPETAAFFAVPGISLSVLRALELLNERLTIMEGRTAQLAPVLDEAHSRLERFCKSLNDFQDSLAPIRYDPTATPDGKFARICDLLERFFEPVPRGGVSLSHYEPFFEKELGNECWTWLDPESRDIFVSAEAVYRFLGGQPAREEPDFSPALLQFCRGLELLCNVKLKDLCKAIAEAVEGSYGVSTLVRQQVPTPEADSVFEIHRTVSLTQTANLLAIGRIVKRIPGALPRRVDAALAGPLGLGDTNLLLPLAHIGIFFRNGKVHPESGSPSLFTPAEEIHVLRKLIFGLDEYHVDGSEFLKRLRNTKWWWFPELERDAAIERLSGEWRAYPGLVKALWTELRRH